MQSHVAPDGCEAVEWRGRSRRARPIREAAFASLKAPLLPVPARVDLMDAREEDEALGRRRIPQCGSRKTSTCPARSS